jgi:hypothetical protein
MTHTTLRRLRLVVYVKAGGRNAAEGEKNGVTDAKRHAVLTFAGSWAAAGTGYPSDVVNAADPDLVFEVPIDAPWSFGPIPPDAPPSPSYAESVEIAVANAAEWIDANPQQTFVLGGYSQGAEAASRVLAEIMTGSLQSMRSNLIGGYTFGNPWRLTGHTFPGGSDPGGRGIAGTNLTAEQIPKDTDGVDTWWDFANPGDLYTTTPNDTAGADITAVYKAAIQVGIDINAMVALIAGLTGQGSLAQQVLGLVKDPIVGGAALVGAIDLAVGFYGTNPPILPHVSYQSVSVLSGQNAIEVAVSHLNNIAGATLARAAV